MNTQRLMVIVEDGKVIGTQALRDTHGTHVAREVGAMLVAGPKQMCIEVDAALPTRFASAADVTAFHRSLEAHIAKLAK